MTMWEDMDSHTASEYLQAMEVLDAQEQLSRMGTADWPNLKKEDRKRIHRKLHKQAYPSTHKDPISPTQLASLLGAGKIK